MTADESHRNCNAFAFILICDGNDDGDLLDCKGDTFSSVNNITEEIDKIDELEKKPKFCLFQICSGLYFDKTLKNYLSQSTKRNSCTSQLLALIK